MRVLHVGHGFVPFHHGGLINSAESLMRAQTAAGHEVAYFFSGRRYPLMRPRVHRWSRDGVAMRELVNSPVPTGYADRGTRRPELDVREADVERLFSRVVDEVRPEVIHFQDLVGLPSSLLELPRRHGVAGVMSLHDYFSLCPTLKLFDVDQRRCRRSDPAPTCVLCCAGASPGHEEERRSTFLYHRRRAAGRVAAIDRLPGPRRALALLRRPRGSRAEPEAVPEAPAAPPLSEEGFRLRRVENVRRLNALDGLLPMSAGVARIYNSMGVREDRMRVMPIAPEDLTDIAPRPARRHAPPLRLVTLNGGSSAAKGAELLASVVERLTASGRTPAEVQIDILGHVHPDVARRLESPLVRRSSPYRREQLDELLEPYDVGIVPSVWDEALGFVGLEMLAKGMPVIGNAVGGIPDYVLDGETGWLNRSCDAEGMTAIVEGILAEPEQVARLSERVLARRSALLRPAVTWLGPVDDLYAEVVAQSSSTAVSPG